ncbi:MAG: hypothetical protein J0L93_06610 [Deltaproteobacteria bacterium]|nr:hypothetical protein [Deltaproteobacteria bacterium]
MTSVLVKRIFILSNLILPILTATNLFAGHRFYTETVITPGQLFGAKSFRALDRDSNEWLVLDPKFQKARVHYLENGDLVYEFFDSVQAEKNKTDLSIGSQFLYVDTKTGKIDATTTIDQPTNHRLSASIDPSKKTGLGMVLQQWMIDAEGQPIRTNSYYGKHVELFTITDGKLIPKNKNSTVSGTDALDQILRGYRTPDGMTHLIIPKVTDGNMNILLKNRSLIMDEEEANRITISSLVDQVENLKTEVASLKSEKAGTQAQISDSKKAEVATEATGAKKIDSTNFYSEESAR